MTSKNEEKYLHDSTETDENLIEKVQKKYCSYFGCPNELTITDQLYSDKCHLHTLKKYQSLFNGKL